MIVCRIGYSCWICINFFIILNKYYINFIFVYFIMFIELFYCEKLVLVMVVGVYIVMD